MADICDVSGLRKGRQYQLAGKRAMLNGRPQRMASKARFKRKPLTEVELTAVVANLGEPGQRVKVAPGMMRNHLYPKRWALYVKDGRTLALDGTLGERREASPVAGSSAVSIEAGESSARIQADEAKVVQQLSKLGPVRFKRKTTGVDVLHGSVTAQDLLSELQARGIPLAELDGEFQAQAGRDGIERGRVKKLGEYLCAYSPSSPLLRQADGIGTVNAKFQHQQQSIIVRVEKD